MASLTFSSLPTCTTTTTNKPFLFSKTSFTHSNQFKVSCTAADNNENPDILPKSSSFERRNLLLGLGGLYGAANIPSAFGEPITAPNSATSCAEASGLKNPREAIRGLSCCPPLPLDGNDVPKPYTFPTVAFDKLRVRKPAHLLVEDTAYIKQFNTAIQKMKDLPDNDPHSWKNQAKIHCAYCNGGYTQVETGHPELTIQVHNSWLFLPFHRWYLYFLEKIMGKVLEDESFALPYWNWDNPAGMMLPAMYEGNIKDPKNAIYDALREPSHLPPAIFDFNYANKETSPVLPDDEQKNVNLALMYRQMISSGSSTLTFMGGQARAGLDSKDERVRSLSLGGSLENGVHTGAHRWVGNSRMPNGEDMGNFYSAGFDPLFYGHHANVDRMWNVWKAMGKQLRLDGHIDPVDEDWLNASYVFYDENRVRVRVYNKDSVHTPTMGYKYESSETPWVTRKPLARPREENVAVKAANDGVKNVSDEGVLPLTLEDGKLVRVLVSRPIEAKNRSPEDKKKTNEMLSLNNIYYSCQKFIRFNVIVNDTGKKPAKDITAAQAEFVGSFAQLPHNAGEEDKMLMKTDELFGITELMEDTKAEGDDFILVTIVPKVGCTGVKITGIDIQMVDAEPAGYKF
uniref:Polyphenol oxidase n=1 Tax=Taraxacum officinale TaxID=50225 RepID=U3UB71_TAROF|nr:polyphenol oxidase precursor [Taraxacum officinale]